jgi:hypothetical protein
VFRDQRGARRADPRGLPAAPGRGAQMERDLLRRYVECEAASSGRVIFLGSFADCGGQAGGPGRICSSGSSAAPQAS